MLARSQLLVLNLIVAQDTALICPVSSVFSRPNSSFTAIVPD
jgi:hypothetical protein